MTEVDVLRRVFDAYNREDVDGVVSEATEDVEYIAGKHGVRVQGRDSWQAVVARVVAALPGRRARVDRVAAAGGVGVVEWVIDGTSSGSVEGFPAAGTQVRWEGCSLVEFRGLQIARWRDYMD